MKKIILIIAIILLATACKTNKSEIYNVKNLKINRKCGEYVIALQDELSESNVYAIYKNTSYDDYERKWTIDLGYTNLIEKHLTACPNDTLYLFEYQNVIALNLENGNEKYTLEKKLIQTMDSDYGIGNINSVLGYDKEYIYYNYNYTKKIDKFYGKISFDLSDVQFITEKDIPVELNK